MIYNQFRDKKLSALGFGCMRLPEKDGQVDVPQVEQMVAYGIEHGVNYFDTAYPYHAGMSERVMGQVLSKYPRESYFLADKFPGHQVMASYDPAALFEEQLRRCRTDYFDFYLLHNVYEKSLDTYLDPKWGILDYFRRQKRLGRIKHLGFSTHAQLGTLEKILDILGDDVEFCQIQLNYLDWTLQDGKAKYDLLTARGIPVWVMEPVRGGKLANFTDPRLTALRPEASTASWGFRFIQGLPNVAMTLSGMSNMEQMMDNVKTYTEENPLAESERDLLLQIAEGMKTAIPCTADLPAGLLPRRCRVYLADNIPTAFVLGILRPTVYLPSDIAKDAAVYVLAHESVHIRRLDPLWKLLSAAALCLHWFNPLVWAAYFCSSADLEYACDEAAPQLLSKVLPDADENVTASYAQALLNITTGKARLGMLALGWGNVPRRIRRLLSATPKRVFCIMLLGICIVVCLFCIGNPPAAFDAADVRMCSLDGTGIPAEHGQTLVDAINNASRSVNRTYDAVGAGTLDHTAVVTFADGTYLEINYLYVSGYSFHPAHPGEDDYKTVLWHRDALGNTVGTWVMEYDFDAVFHDWMIAAEGTPDTGNVIVSAPSDSETGLAVVMYSDGLTADIPLLSVPYDESLDYDRLPVITVQNDAMIQISGIGGETLSVSEDYYENRGNSTFIARQTLKLNRENGGIFSFMTEHRNPNREESAIYYIGAKECRYCFKVWFPQTKQLTLDDVIRLSAKGTELTWEDFSGYKFTETGSGLYIRVYEIDENFSLWIGGGSPLSEPMYIYLARADDLDMRIDIRYSDAGEFIKSQQEYDSAFLFDRPLRYYIDLAWTEAEHIIETEGYHLQKSTINLLHHKDKTIDIIFFTDTKESDYHSVTITLIPQSDGSYAVDS